MPKDISLLFCPKSVAIAGASRTPNKVGGIILKNLQSQYKGAILPINPNATEINGIKCYPSINDLPAVPDLLIIALPAATVSAILNSAGERGIKNVVVISAGFKEIGADGEQLEKSLIDISTKYSINMLGPNCLGFINNKCDLNATFAQPVHIMGNARFISQSGALAAGIFDWCNTTGVGIDTFVTLGNKAVLNENDILRYFIDNPVENENSGEVYPIGMYLESISNGPEFMKVVKETSVKNPVFILKPGKTSAGAAAMQSHTGSMAGEDDVFDTAIFQSGAIRCQTIEDFFDLSKAFSWGRIPKGDRVAIISNAGGPAVISSDAVLGEGLRMAEIDQHTKEKLSQILPRYAGIINPVDVLGDSLAESYAQALEILLQADTVDSVVALLTPQVMTQIEKTAQQIGEISSKYNKPVFCSFIGGNLVAEGEKILNSLKIPSFRYPERAIHLISVMYGWYKQTKSSNDITSLNGVGIDFDTNSIQNIISTAVKNDQKTLDNIQVNDILNLAKISTPATKIVSSNDEASSFSHDVGWPVVLKLSSPGLLHKKDIGGVITNINNPENLSSSWEKITRKIDDLPEDIRKHVTVQVQKQVEYGIEVIVGVKTDPTFGRVLMFGAGGSYVELIDDTNLHMLPVDYAQVKRLIENSKIFSILKGSRGDPPYALEKLYALVTRFANLASQINEIEEFEINPVIVTLNDATAVDGKIVLKKGAKKPLPTPKFHVAATLEHKILATKYHSYTFETEDPLIYKPGQYVTVKVADDAVRCYSIASSEGPNRFSLLIDTSPGGPGSRYFNNIKVGDKILYIGPFGQFILHPDDGSENLLFLATGCGCSPLRNMIDALLKELKSQKNIYLYFGLGCPSDVFWKDYFENLEKEYSNFKLILTVDKPDDMWEGNVGFITDLIKKDFPDASNCSAYLCGSLPMIQNATKLLEGSGCLKERIYMEKL